MTLGPSAANYGSDSMGGTINVLTVEPRFALPGDRRAWHGEYNLLGAGADLSGETSGRATMTTPRFALTSGASVSRHNDVRAGRGTIRTTCTAATSGWTAANCRMCLATGYRILGFCNTARTPARPFD